MTAALHKELPPYNTALGPSEETLVVVPPFTFPGVTARVFPLRANMNILTTFCNSYLNLAPEVCELRPYFPYVLLVVLDYGRMAIEQYNLGWVSQHEVFFAVPLGMWRRSRRGRRIFDKWVLNTPFIVVDNPTSLTTGRETYGWPKVLATLQHNPERWLIDPRNPIRFLSLDVMGPDSDRSSVRLLEIDQQVDQNPSLVPPDLGVIDPYERLSRLSRASWSIGFDLAQLLLGSPLAGFDSRYVGERREVFFDSLRQVSGFYGKPGLDVVTLKQFREASDPTQVCYQALVESRLSVARFNSGGPLGAYNLLQGDITGGFKVRLFDNPAFPIVESLGLEVAGERTVRGRVVSFLEPFFPFWMSVDLNYGRGETICWRTCGKPWYVGKNPVGRVPPKRTEGYNNVAGGAAQVWYGPYLIPEASFDVYPLEADSETLALFLDRYLNADRSYRFSLDKHDGKAYVYMIASANRMFSKARSEAWMQSRQVAFYVPLEMHWSHESRQVLATPFAFVHSPALVVTMREVQGVPAMNATITAPSRLAGRDGPVLNVQVDVFAALGAGLPSHQRTLIEVVPGARISEPSPADCPFHDRVFPSQVMERLMLKQFRDAEDPDRACYQALVLEPWSLLADKPAPRTTWFRRERLVHVYRYPSLPLVQSLGLITRGIRPPREPEGAIADVLEARHPFRTRLGLEIGLGQELSYTAGFLPWIPRYPLRARSTPAVDRP